MTQSSTPMPYINTINESLLSSGYSYMSERMESLIMHRNMTMLYLCHFGAVYLTIGGGGNVGGEVGFYVLLES